MKFISYAIKLMIKLNYHLHFHSHLQRCLEITLQYYSDHVATVYLACNCVVTAVLESI